MHDWHLRVDLAGTLTDEQLEDLSQDPITIITALADQGTVTVETRLDAGEGTSMAPAVIAAGHVTNDMPQLAALIAAGTLTVERITVESATAHARTLPLLGAAEAAATLGISTARLRQLQQERADFPAPAAAPAGGRLWYAADIAAFNRRWKRQPGRPRKAVT